MKHQKSPGCQRFIRTNLRDMFRDVDIGIITGHCVLGRSIRITRSSDLFQSGKLAKYRQIHEKLAQLDKNPSKSLSCFRQGVQHRLMFLSCTTPDIERTIQDTITMIKLKLIPNFTGHRKAAA